MSIEAIKLLTKKVNTTTVFSAVVGNPPYQKAGNGNNTASYAIYHDYMTTAERMSQYISMVYPSRWMLGGVGSGIDSFRLQEGLSKHYRKFYDYSNGMIVFPNTSINGGVNYFLWDKDKLDGTVEYHYNSKTMINKNTLGDNHFVRDPLLYPILRKIDAKNTLSSIAHPNAYYGKTLRNATHLKSVEKHGTGVYGYAIQHGKGLLRLEIEYPNVNNKVMDDYKVAVSRTGSMLKRNSYHRIDRIVVIEPNAIFTENFIKIGSFETRGEAENCLLYLKTDFCNFLIGVLTASHNISRNNYKLIPLIDFKTGEIIDKPGVFLDFNNVETLDQQLYSIYNINKNEQKLLTKNIRPWKDKTSVTADE